MGATPNRPTDNPTVEQTHVPPDMAHYYRNYRSPGRGKSWGPTNKHPPNHLYARTTRFTRTANLADGREPLPRATKSDPWLPPRPDPTLGLLRCPNFVLYPMLVWKAFQVWMPSNHDITTNSPSLRGMRPATPHPRTPLITRRPRPSTQITYQTRTRTQT